MFSTPFLFVVFIRFQLESFACFAAHNNFIANELIEIEVRISSCVKSRIWSNPEAFLAFFFMTFRYEKL